MADLRIPIAQFFVAAAVSAAAPPAYADFFTNLFAPMRSSSAAIGPWQTTVTRATVVATLDPAWSAAVIATAPPRITTASISPGNGRPLLPGPRVTGNGHALQGVASYYWEEQTTATGERFDKRAMTAAHKTLPFGTRVRVTRVDTGKAVVVRINDRGPYKVGRIIDLSERAAEGLGMTAAGTTPVRLEVLGQ